MGHRDNAVSLNRGKVEWSAGLSDTESTPTLSGIMLEYVLLFNTILLWEIMTSSKL